MALIILIPALLCWAVLARSTARTALLTVYLPTLLLLPQYYVLRIQHLPPVSFADAAILPLAIALLATGRRYWRSSWMDLWILLLPVSAAISETLNGDPTWGDWVGLFSPGSAASQVLGRNIANGGLAFVGALLTIVLPYMIGKMLLEQQDSDGQPMRRKFVKQMLMLLTVVGLLSVYDFVKETNLWQSLASPLQSIKDEDWPTQVRWGFGRIAGPYGHAILAGMVFLIGVVYCLWLRRADPQWGARRIVAGLPFTLRGLVLTAVVGGLLMTQSRGPWLGVGLALVFALLTRVLSVGRAAIAFLVFLTVFGVFAYTFGRQYTDRDMLQASTQEQRNAIYRRQLLANYAPFIAERPVFGWGAINTPQPNGQQSIDDEYLLLTVTHGFFGLGLFLTIVAGTATRLLQFLARPMRHEDRILVFAHMAVLIGLMTTIATVYMGEQLLVLFYIFIGWVQGMNPAFVTESASRELNAQASFRRVLV